MKFLMAGIFDLICYGLLGFVLFNHFGRMGIIMTGGVYMVYLAVAYKLYKKRW